MNKNAIWALALLASISSTSHAKLKNLLSCQDAGGFYGNITVGQENGNIEIRAAQGFAETISQSLEGASGYEAYEFKIVLPQNQCTDDSGNFRCSGPARVVSKWYSAPNVEFDGEIELSAKRPEISLL